MQIAFICNAKLHFTKTPIFMTIQMEKLSRWTFLKHYIGAFAMVLGEEHNQTGQIENVDMEDSGVQIKSGERSQWVDGDMVTPALRSFSSLTEQHLADIIAHLRFGGKGLGEPLNVIPSEKQIMLGYDGSVVFITKNWSIYRMKNDGEMLDFPDNIGTIIFLLCELGYKVSDDLK